MHAQVDYEAEVQLAVFPSNRSAEAAANALRAARVEYTQGPLLAGRYQVADTRLWFYAQSVIGAAVVGGVIGASVGVALALIVFGTLALPALWFAVAGAGGGAVVGGLVGVQVRSRYDADVARTLHVPRDGEAVLLTIHANAATGVGPGRVRELLEHAGAIAFLDVPAYESRVREAAGPRVIDSTSAGGN